MKRDVLAGRIWKLSNSGEIVMPQWGDKEK